MDTGGTVPPSSKPLPPEGKGQARDARRSTEPPGQHIEPPVQSSSVKRNPLEVLADIWRLTQNVFRNRRRRI